MSRTLLDHVNSNARLTELPMESDSADWMGPSQGSPVMFLPAVLFASFATTALNVGIRVATGVAGGGQLADQDGVEELIRQADAESELTASR